MKDGSPGYGVALLHVSFLSAPSCADIILAHDAKLEIIVSSIVFFLLCLHLSCSG